MVDLSIQGDTAHPQHVLDVSFSFYCLCLGSYETVLNFSLYYILVDLIPT
ncbi:hypothetical protein RND71_015795 [Anisodus tanguticus]|uniref:Uncharacterized protein n=1 Tax=Anisodus tanguticus TaxID=243964 RepID=A0AAE1S775_9SOLA|nr:hypothetical protein RND71_015795 [Anisodus tanguticus]